MALVGTGFTAPPRKFWKRGFRTRYTGLRNEIYRNPSLARFAPSQGAVSGGEGLAGACGNRTHPGRNGRPAHGFEDREGHQTPCAPMAVDTAPRSFPSAGTGATGRVTAVYRMRGGRNGRGWRNNYCLKGSRVVSAAQPPSGYSGFIPVGFRVDRPGPEPNNLALQPTEITNHRARPLKARSHPSIAQTHPTRHPPTSEPNERSTTQPDGQSRR